MQGPGVRVEGQQQSNTLKQPNRIAFVVGVTAVGLLKLSLNGIGGDSRLIHVMGFRTAPTHDSIVGAFGMKLEPVRPQALGKSLDRRIV